MKLLKNILYKVSITSVTGDTASQISSITFDSRLVTSHSVFVAIVGSQTNGHHYIDNAIALGATTIVCQTMPKQLDQQVTYIEVPDTQKALAIMAANYYEHPSEHLKLIGVTGTNGKTTVTSLLYQLFKNAGYKVGLLSTVKIMVNDDEYKTSHTTPDSLTINKYLNIMRSNGVTHCFMEVSSHGIHQNRTKGLQFAAGVFTNLSHDHLDYHNTFAEYRDVKKQFFDELPKTSVAITNTDDKNGAIMVQNTSAEVHTYALKSMADFQAKIIENQFSGLLLQINNTEVWTKLIGQFNAYNVLAIYATATLLGIEQTKALRHISALNTVSGRFQYSISDSKITAIVDYAHTPDALKNVLQTINTIRTHSEQLITVVGCGGDRDAAKRPKMGHIASALSTKTILTSDNPRTENPETIIKDMEQGIAPENYNKVLSITNREQAIKTACQFANTNDIVLIAGKGHETYQEINGERFDFDDFKIVKHHLKQLNK